MENLPPPGVPKKPCSRCMIVSAILIVLVSSILSGLLGYALGTQQQTTEKQVACTMDAKICPDGSLVGRSGPNCEFAPCASINPGASAQWETYINDTYDYSINYPIQDPTDPVSKQSIFTDELFKIYNLFSIEPIETSKKDPQEWWNSESQLEKIDPRIVCYNGRITRTVKSYYNPQKTLIEFDRDILLLEKNGENTRSFCKEPYIVAYKTIIIPHNGKLLRVAFDAATLAEEILSTFKLLE